MNESEQVIKQNIGLFSRQSGIVAPDELPEHVVIVGAGGIGSWTALALAKMGVKKLTIVDFDQIEDVNIAPQIYGMGDIGKLKCEVLADFINKNMKQPIATPIPVAWEDWEEKDDYLSEDVEVLVMAVDSMDVRIQIWRDIKTAGLGLVVDGRMMREVLQAFAIKPNDPEQVKNYEENHLYPSSTVDPVPCTERAVAYNQFVIAGVIGTLIKHFAKDDLVNTRVLIDLYSFSTIVE